jgi:putative transposase
MARPLRIEFPGAIYHVTSRGNERKDVFRDDKDRAVFLDILSRCCNLFNWQCHAYCLMGNHYHLIIETIDGNLSKGMRHLNGVYTQKFNWNHNTVGHIFQGRFKAILIEKETHLLQACRYVVLNPVRAKITKKPEGWQWSSFCGTAGLTTPVSLLTTDWLLQQFGEKPKVAQRRYRNFVTDGIGGPSIWEDVRSQIILGDDGFVEKFSEVAKGIEELSEVPKSQRFLHRQDLEGLFPNEARHDKKLRNRLIIEAVEVHGYDQKAVADHLQLHYSTVSRIMAGSSVKTQQ